MGWYFIEILIISGTSGRRYADRCVSNKSTTFMYTFVLAAPLLAFGSPLSLVSAMNCVYNHISISNIRNAMQRNAIRTHLKERTHHCVLTWQPPPPPSPKPGATRQYKCIFGHHTDVKITFNNIALENICILFILFKFMSWLYASLS